MNRNDLKARLDTLSDTAIRFVARMVDSLASPPAASSLGPVTWLSGTPAWVEYFGLALSVHHGTTVDPLGLNGFEAVFGNACEAVDWEVQWAESATYRFSDLTVVDDKSNSRRLSLKSTAAQNLSRSTVHISKLTEAAWIQDVRTARVRRRRTLELFKEYTDAVDGIIMLRAFRTPGNVPSRYQLIEIPTGIFDSLQSSTLTQFDSDGPRVMCSYGSEPAAATIALDRSDAKITVTSIKLSVCTVHVEWDLASSQLPLGGAD